ncbi:MAG: hypothetical protein ACD_22C00025G0006 [uncultured bacterium]|uniref:Peptidase MA-like domain-containing protein n=1 Tax=candidate division WWE3 bacterium RBG_16_37_10 TaxID=1802610 RepID=A0A1F4UYZ3_UNCKA|nr:MAG: hypothetical protein ACD_22C00025G0006 [uncultured bacterium]OGC50148.1 MAG: hypothetical protein A2W32_00945 [candidate division WWE3 bacterium RBG_16_37_10]
MTSVFKLTPLEDTTLQKYHDTAIKDLNEFFGRKWLNNTPKIFVLDNRETINLFQERETESWLVGFSMGNSVCILNPANISRESSQDGSKYNIEKLIKHEMCHSFFQKTFGMTNFLWITEGVSIYVADQFDMFPIPSKFDGFLDGKKTYQESGAIIKLLFDKYGKDKLFDFLKKQSGIKEMEELKTVFEGVFDAKLEYSFFESLIH